MHICVVLCLGPPVYRLDLSLIESIIHRTPVTSTFFSQFWSQWNWFSDATDQIHKSLSLSLSLSPPKSKSEFPKCLLIGSLSLALHLIETCWLLQSSSLRQFVRIYKMSAAATRAAFHSNCFTFALHSNCSHLDSSDKFHHPVQSLMLCGASWVLDIGMLICCVLWWTSWSVVAKWSQSKTYYINLADKETTASDVEWKMKF